MAISSTHSCCLFLLPPTPVCTSMCRRHVPATRDTATHSYCTTSVRAAFRISTFGKKRRTASRGVVTIISELYTRDAYVLNRSPPRFTADEYMVGLYTLYPYTPSGVPSRLSVCVGPSAARAASRRALLVDGGDKPALTNPLCYLRELHVDEELLPVAPVAAHQ